MTTATEATQHTLESGAAMVVKAAPPVTVSIATVAGYHVSELVMWATLIYTVLMASHKLLVMILDLRDRWHAPALERRVGAPDARECPVERRGRSS